MKKSLFGKFHSPYAKDGQITIDDYYLAYLHSAAANGRWGGDQRPPCGLKTAG